MGVASGMENENHHNTVSNVIARADHFKKIIEKANEVNDYSVAILNHGCLVYMFSLCFSGSKFLINLRRQFRVRKIFRTQVFAGFAVFSFCCKN